MDFWIDVIVNREDGIDDLIAQCEKRENYLVRHLFSHNGNIAYGLLSLNVDVKHRLQCLKLLKKSIFSTLADFPDTNIERHLIQLGFSLEYFNKHYAIEKRRMYEKN